MTNVAITTTHQISPPYPGTAPFQDKREDRLVFYGRDQEVHALMELVLSESQVLLFARSGLGKTSLINAGLLEKLRERNFFPVTVRVTDDEDGGPIAAILHRINEEAAIHGVQVKGNQDAPSLWAYFDQVRFLRNEPIKSKPVSLRPILVFDQFEEVFTLLPKDRRETFISDLADLVCGQAPRHVRNEALKKLDEISDDNPERQRIMDLAYGRPIIDVKVLISIREDFLAELEALKTNMPDIFRDRLRLESLTPAKARDAIVKPSQQKELLGENVFDFEPGVVDALINFLSTRQTSGTVLRSEDIDPVQLQILCRSLFDRILKSGRKRIALTDLGGEKGMRRILRQYYFHVVRKFPFLRIGWNPRKYRLSVSNLWIFNLPRYAAHQLCENGLILPNLVRNSLEGGYIASTYGVPKSDLVELVEQRLLRGESRSRGKFYELSHDSLINVLLAARAKRRMIMAASFAFVLFWFGVAIQPTVIQPTVDVTSEKIIKYKTAPLRAQIADASIGDQKRLDAFRKLEDMSDPQVIDLSDLILRALNLDKHVFNKAVSFQTSKLINSSLIATEYSKELAKQFESGSGNAFDFRNTMVRDTKFDRGDFRAATFDGALINRTSFESTMLLFARFNGAMIDDVSFSGALLFGANFFNATLDKVTFLGSDLRYARFGRAKLENVSFSGAKLEHALFEDIVLGEKVDFDNTDWWLGGGWRSDQIASLEKKFPHTDYAKTPAYLGGLKDRQRTVDEARLAQNAAKLSLALNGIAWYRAIHGVDLLEADAEADEGMQKAKTDNILVLDIRQYHMILDTKAYILALRARLEDQTKRREGLEGAKKLFIESLQREDEPVSPLSAAERSYHYALTLDYLGESSEADKYYKISDDAGYRPTYELLLMPRLERLGPR